MPITQLPITNGFYKSESLPISAQECTNWYVNVVQTNGLTQETLFGTPGIEQIATTGSVQQQNRGAWVLAGVPYFVNGISLYRLNSDNTVDTIGTIPSNTRVSMADNGTQLMILIPGGNGYIFTAAPDTLTQITDVDFTANGVPQHVVFLDGYFVCSTDSKKFIISALNNGLAYNALDFGTAEANPDDITAPVVFKNQLFMGGTQTAEAFQNIGGADFPFRRSGLFLDKGISAPFSVANTNDTFMFIGAGKNESPAIWQFAGNTVSKVSTTAIDSILQRFTAAEIAEAFSWTYAQKGAYFVGFVLPTTTLVIDAITGRWHERKSRILGAGGAINTVRFRVNSMVQAYGKVIVFDYIDGRVGSLDPDVYTEYGNNIRRVVATQPFQNNMQSFLCPMIELTTEAGVGNTAVENPVMAMDISTDGGKTFRDERIRELGAIGEYNRRAIWRRNGRAPRFMVMRFILSDAVKPVIIQLTADFR